MYIKTILPTLLLAMLCPAAPSQPARSKQAKPVVVGYILADPDTPLDPATIAARKLTRVNYAFFRVDGGVIAPRRPSDEVNLAALAKLQEINPNLEIVVSVGGGGLGSAGFSDMAITPEGRKRFVDSAVSTIRRYRLDGIDLDWEYPGYAHAAMTVRPEDKENYTLLLKELRLRLNREGKRLGRRLITSSATGATTIWLEHTDMRAASKWLDTVNMMCYDWYNETEKNTGHDSPLYTNPADPKAISIDHSVRLNLAAGVPSRKLVIGVPFYGRQWTGVEAENHGLWQPIAASPASGSTLVFGQISPLVNANGFVRFWDPVAMTPFLYNAASRTFITYNDAEAEAARAAYVKSHHLGGIMFWQYGGDPKNVLLDAIDSGLGVGH